MRVRLGFGPLKEAYRKYLYNHIKTNDKTPFGKVQFLRAFTHARDKTLTTKNIQSVWRATGLMSRNINKSLNSRQVLHPEPSTPPPTETSRNRQYHHETPQKASYIMEVMGTFDAELDTKR